MSLQLSFVAAEPPASSVTVTVARYPEGNILPGEVAIFTITGVSGYDGNVSRDLDFEWSWDDASATFATATGLPTTDANVDYGRVVAKAWTTTGTKAPTLTIRDRTGILGTQNLSVTVQDPNTVSWDKEIYVSFAGNFGGAPTASSTIRHVSTIADLVAEGPGNPATSTRIVFRRGEEFAWGATSVPARGRCYITSLSTFGSGAFPILKPGVVVDGPGDGGGIIVDDGDDEETGSGVLSLFDPANDGDQSRFTVYRIDADGGFDPSTGFHTPDFAKTNFCSTDNAASGALYRSFCQVRTTGMREMYSSIGTYRNVQGTDVTYLGIYDVASNNYSNYGFAQWGSHSRVAVCGFECLMPPDTLMRDDKDKRRNESTDHGPVRVTACEHFGITNSNMLGSGGWTVAGPTYAMQPILRVLPVYTNTGNNTAPTSPPSAYQSAIVNIQRNRGASATFLSIGRNNSTDRGFMPLIQAVVDRNDFTVRRHTAGSFISASTSGVHARNNVIYASNLDESSGSKTNYIMNLVQPTEANWLFAEGWSSEPTVVEFNTFVSDRQDTGPNGNLVEVNFNPGSWAGAAPVAENNILHAPSQNTPVTTWAPLNPANMFKPVGGSSAIDAVSSGSVPVRDFSGAIRRATTNRGAWDSSDASAGIVPAPVNTSVPTIAELAVFPDEYHATSLGVWSNLDTHPADPYLQEYNWQRNGNALPFVFGNQSVWNAGVITWIADDDAGTPTGLQVRRGQNSTGATADARGGNESTRGFGANTFTINSGLAGAHTAWFVHRHIGSDSSISPPVSIASNATTSQVINGPTGTYTITGNGDGTYGVVFTPFTGNLTLRVTYTNRSGTRVNATSAPLALP